MNRFLVGIVIAVILVFLVVFMLPSGNQTPPSSPGQGTQETSAPANDTPEDPTTETSDSESPTDQVAPPRTTTQPRVSPQAISGPQSNAINPSGLLPVPTVAPPKVDGEFTLQLVAITPMKERVAGAAVQWGESSDQTNTNGEVMLGFNAMPQTIQISHPNYQPTTLELTVDDFDATQSLRREVILGVQGTITGVVMDNFQSPVSQAQVSVQAMQGIWIKQFVTNEKGVFVIDSPPDSGLTISTTHPQYTDTAASRMEITPPYPAEVNLTLSQDGYTISGMVLEEENNLGVPDFDVLIESDGVGEQFRKVVRSNPAGAYSSGDIPRGVYRISPAPDNRQRIGFDQSTVNQFQTITLNEWDVSDVNILVSRGATITGTVFDSQGSPIANAQVFPEYDPSTSSNTTSDGSFFLSGVFASQSNNQSRTVTLIADHEQQGSGSAEVVMEQNLPPDHVEITLVNDTQVNGTVVDPQNSPVSDAQITLTVPHLSNYQMTAVSDGSGSFTLDLPGRSSQSESQRGEYPIRVEKIGYSSLQTKISIDQPSVVLQMEFAGVLQGRIVDEQNRGVSDVLVSARSPRHGNFEAVSGPDGTYRIEPIPEGVFDVFATTDQLTGSVYQVSPNLEPVDILVRAVEWEVAGPIWDIETELPLNHYTVNIEVSPFAAKARPFFDQQEFHTPDGYYMLRFSIPGEYRLLFSAEGYESQQRVVRIAPDVKDNQYIGAGLAPVESTGTIQGSFVPSAGTALHGIEIIGVDSYPMQSNAFTINDVPTGTHDIVIYIRSTDSNTVVATGVLSSILVQPDQTTDLGALGPANFNANLFQPQN